ncbi:AGE family epimerase/isomerase [Gluconacetobacter takamatsuzukensis]|nr:AGE family epimerase/isomerase [Gluconacetobacter takamatsuzukensis]
MALPLWCGDGFDHHRGLFHERLAWDGSPVPMGALRLMVQARQVATYCRAALDGLHDISQAAVRCLDIVERLYHGSDGSPGWIFSLSADGAPADRRRDLYAHAFILFAYGWAIRLTGEDRYRRIARRTADEIERIFAAENGGYKDVVPAMDELRRQNPHMHLLEAYLVLFEVTGDAFYHDRIRALTKLGLDHLIDPRSGLLLEFFDCGWLPSEPAGRNRVEPGHLFEWAWLLHEYERLAAPGGAEADLLHATTERLFHVGLSKGSDPSRTGFVYDAMTDDGVVFERSTRIWPQTELLRLLCRRRDLGRNDGVLTHRISLGFLERYAPVRLGGGWIDRLDEAGAPLVDHMPASSLYHIYGAGREMVRFETVLPD